MVSEAEKSFQQWYSLACTLAPAVMLGVVRAWWVGVLALVCYVALSYTLIPLTLRLPLRLMTIAAYLEPIVIAVVVICLGLLVF